VRAVALVVKAAGVIVAGLIVAFLPVVLIAIAACGLGDHF
jgi:hypothetical protein